MPIFLLFYLILTAMPLPWSEPRFGRGPWGSAGVTTALIALPVLAAWLLANRAGRRLRAEPQRRGEIVRRYHRGKLFQFYGVMAMHLLARSQGVATLANALHDEKFIRQEVQKMRGWLNACVESAPRNADRKHVRGKA